MFHLFRQNNFELKVVVFLTSASEVQPGWLQPLLSRLAKDEFTLAAPVADFIEQDNFAYTPANIEDSYGVFGWDLQFLWTAGDLGQKEDMTGAVETPHIRGSLLAMSRKHFQLLGGFDEVVCGTTDVLGLVLKVWLCGGKVEVVPCSHVGVVNRLELVGRLRYQQPTGGETCLQRRANLRQSVLSM